MFLKNLVCEIGFRDGHTHDNPNGLPWVNQKSPRPRFPEDEADHLPAALACLQLTQRTQIVSPISRTTRAGAEPTRNVAADMTSELHLAVANDECMRSGGGVGLPFLHDCCSGNVEPLSPAGQAAT
jgi:hypothetical protein